MRTILIASWAALVPCMFAQKTGVILAIQLAAILGVVVATCYLLPREVRKLRALRREAEVLELACGLLRRDAECQQAKFDRLEMAARN